jgi:hypothetical protein
MLVFFFFCLFIFFSFSLLQIAFGVIPSPKVDQCLTVWVDDLGG